MTNPAPPPRPRRPSRPHARTQAIELFRRPFAPGAIGFRAMSKVALDGDPYGGAQVAAYLGAQSVVQRLNAVVPGRWRQQFAPRRRRAARPPATAKPRASSTSPAGCTSRSRSTDGGPDVEAVYEDIGEIDAGSLAGLKALYCDARKRAAVAAGIGAYLYTALAAVVLPIGPGARQVQAIRRQGKSDLLVALPRDRGVAARRLPRAHEHRRRPARPRPDPRPRRARDGIGQGEAPTRPPPTSRPPPSAGDRRRNAPATSSRRLRRPRPATRAA